VTHTLEFTARVALVQEATLFFRADGHLARLLEARDVASTRNPTGIARTHRRSHALCSWYCGGGSFLHPARRVMLIC